MKIYRVVMIGFGQMAYSYSLNKEYSSEIKFASHSQALSFNNRLDWDSVVDPDTSALEEAKESLDIKHTFKAAKDIPDKDSVEIVVFSCPPSVDKIAILELFPNIKGIVLEKPLSNSLDQVSSLREYLKIRKIKAQVSFLRRGDEFISSLSNKGLEDYIGEPINAQIIYGNGIRNNGSHMIDLTRILLGEVKAVLFSKSSTISNSSLEGDENRTFILEMQDQTLVSGFPLNFKNYRENSLDIWGNKGRIAFTQEGSYFQHWTTRESRFGLGFKEIDWSSPKIGKTNIGNSLDILYRNLILHIETNEPLVSSLDSAIKTENLLYEILNFKS